ncbi:sigma-70 family RNA polymerase sigma factor [filamentous cyanobacterium LEGE 11480]|uniref:Sigma-70 family RNA polymerase sigma factor n=1 Tax=Romeriopsis navalis LEGE 11480 TaxID=2777977 RepID=A0A928Z3I8_9CYAN|nr:sigma-70 family RNA polymerase sigma factor [Romeriopsis navalis]MBE9031561.1 sigma-70 family RNA polymerase sigma factor [Romeriopsis navalis LEGE 11480]
MIPASTTPDNRCDEIHLMKRIAQQDQSALSQLYDRYARVIYSVAHKSLGSVEECEEVVLDVFAQVWRTASRYDPARSRVDTWLFMIARSRVLDRLRGVQRRGKVTEAVMAPDFSHTQAPPSPSEHAEIAERRTQVLNALQQLPPEQQQVLEMSYYQGLTQREIAAQTGMALGTVKTRIRLGLEKLRSALHAESWDSV